MLEQPGQLAGGEVGVERHPAPLPDLLGAALRLEAIEDLLGALVLPGDDRSERPSGLGVPHEDRFALVVEPARGDVRLVSQQLRHGVDHGLDDHLGVLLDPTRLRMDKRFLAPRLLHRPQVGVEKDRLDG